MNATIKLFITFLVCLFIGQAGAIGLGLLADRISNAAGLAVFIPIYYVMFWVAWRVALRLVDPEARRRPTDGGGTPATTAIWLLAPATLALELCD